ncbi:MAG TPA: phage tail sheath C-terminal domain-containing protein [Silvibacterium sp.]|nr:phage tail sheath C-terminal domain-containing protein [Silvibacterium sp.]
MPPVLSYPGVYIEELPSAVHPITGVATAIAAFVGYTERGIDNRAEQIFSFGDYERLFGGLGSDSELSYAVQQFFNNGGNQAYVVRAPRAGATGAQVVFGSMTFTALSSGTWANGELTIDVDFSGLAQPVVGTFAVSSGGTAVTGTGTFFTTALKPNQWLVFASDPAQTPCQIASIANDTSLTLNPATPYPGPTTASTTAVLIGDPLAFNLTITNLVDGTIETFPNVSLNNALQNYVVNVVNDPDNGSQLVGVQVAGAPTTAPPASGIIGTALTISNITNTLGGSTALAGTVTVTNGSTGVTGAGTSFTTALKVGQWLVFASDPTATLYQISTITNNTTLTLASKFTGMTTAGTTAKLSITIPTTDCGIAFNVSLPVTLPPLPIAVKVFAKNVPLPLSVAGLASQLQKAINAALSVQMAGALVQCTVSGVGSGQAIRVNALLPQVPDAVITITAPPGTSSLTDASVILGLNPPANGNPAGKGNVAHYTLGTNHVWAQQTSSQPGSDGTGLPGNNELIGDPGTFTGIYALEKIDLFNLLCIADATRAAPGNPSALDPAVDPNAIYAAAVALCDARRAFLIVDSPPFVNSVAKAVDWITTGLTVKDANAAAFFPRLRLPDPLNNFQLRTFAPCGVVAGLYSRIDTTRGVFKAPAGTEATLSGVQGLVYKLTDAENGALNPLGLNCFRTFPVYGSVLWGARTLLGADADASQWKYVPVRRVALFLEESLYRGTQWVVFEPNDEPLWSAIRLNVGSFMQNLFRQGYFQGQTPAQAYFVKCDSETTTQTDIDLGIVNIVVGFAPLKPAEFVVIQIQQITNQSGS